MANYDLTTKATAGINTDQLNDVYPDVRRPLYMIQKVVDVADLISRGIVATSLATNDTLIVMDVPAKTMIVSAGAEVLTAFNTNTTINIGLDSDSGDDNIVDEAAADAVGFLAAGTNGSVSLNARVTTADTVKVTVAGATVTRGKLRVYLLAADISDFSSADEVDRDQLA